MYSLIIKKQKQKLKSKNQKNNHTVAVLFFVFCLGGRRNKSNVSGLATRPTNCAPKLLHKHQNKCYFFFEKRGWVSWGSELSKDKPLVLQCDFKEIGVIDLKHARCCSYAVCWMKQRRAHVSSFPTYFEADEWKIPGVTHTTT